MSETAATAPKLHQKLVSSLLERIASGGFRIGERLPSELSLAAEFGVSRGVVRELLRSLEDKHVIEVRSGKGALVRPVDEWNMLDLEVLIALMATPTSVAVLSDYLEVRRILETESAALAAQRATGSDLTRMADALSRMNATALASQHDPLADQQFHQADIEFHGAIFQASGNRVLPRVTEPIQRAMATLRPRLALHPEHRLKRTIPEHKKILSAIADRDSDAARVAMAEHLSTVENYLTEYRVRSEASA